MSTSDGGESMNVKVMVRVRPFSQREIKISQKKGERLNCAVRMRGSTCAIVEHSRDERGFAVEKEREAFQFDTCFWSIPVDQETEPSNMPFANQVDVYNESGKVALDAAFQGFNTCIFAYGQTGSGKTHSMLGNDADPGVSPRLVDDLFGRIAQNAKLVPTTKCEVEVTFFEIYNEKVRDLFADKAKAKRSGNYDAPRIRQHPTKGVFVEGLERHAAKTAAETKAFMEDGAAERAMAPTKMNLTSSRSHAVFQIQLTQLDALKGTQKVATINLVDLAGSEKVKMSEVTGDALTEATNINKSLSTLRRVIDTLIENSTTKRQKTPPFRESVLTYLLSDSLGGNSKTMMISAISPHESNIEDTIGTLRYALRAKAIVCNAHVNEEKSAAMVDAMKDEIMALRTRLATGGGGGGGGGGAMPEEIQREIAEKEAEVNRMETQQEEMRTLIEESKRENEEMQVQLQEAATVVHTQKRERFAAAFRNAFLIAKDKQRIQASNVELDQAKEQLARMEYSREQDRALLDEARRQNVRAEDAAADAQAAYDAERQQLLQEVEGLTRQVRGLAEDKTALSQRVQELSFAEERALQAQQTTEARLRQMQNDMLAVHRKVELVAAEKEAVVERLEAEMNAAELHRDDLRRRRDKYKMQAGAASASSRGLRDALDEGEKDRAQLLATVKAQQQLLNERATLIDQLNAQLEELHQVSTDHEQRYEGKEEEVRILVEALGEYEAAASRWMAEHTQAARELQHLRRHAMGGSPMKPVVALQHQQQGLPVGTSTRSGTPGTVRGTSVTTSSRAPGTPRRARSPVFASSVSPAVRQPIVQPVTVPATSRARWQ